MGSCCNKCRQDHFDCLCKKKCHPIEKECPPQKEFVHDCICHEWSVQHGGTQTIFQSGGFENIFTSGIISYECGLAPFVLVLFFKDNQPIGDPIQVFHDSSVSFVYKNFNKIKVICPDGAGVNSANGDDECTNTCEGSISLKARFDIN
jgi:hypothetical protein